MTTRGAAPGVVAAEVTGLASVQAYAAGMQQACTGATATAEAIAAELGAHGVHDPAVTAIGRAQDLTRRASAAWATAITALDQQTAVKEAYAGAPDAGGKQFLTEAGPGTHPARPLTDDLVKTSGKAVQRPCGG